MANWEFLKKRNGAVHENEQKHLENNDNVIIIESLEEYGFQQAGKCTGGIGALKNNISSLYHNKITNDSNAKVKEEKRLSEINKKIHDENSELEKIENDITEGNINKKNIEDEILELKKKKEQISSGDKKALEGIEPPDRIGYIIGIVILIFLTAYLILFYTSAIYNSFIYNATEAGRNAIIHKTSIATTIFNPNAIGDSFNKSFFSFLFIITSPMIFLGLGYLIHKFNETKKYLYTTLILTFTLLFDAVLGYAIVSEIYEAKYITGLSGIDKPWEFNMIFSQVPFYIILSAGFVIYIVWGVVLSFVIKAHNNLNPIRSAIKSIIVSHQHLEARRKELAAQLGEICNKKSFIASNIKKLKEDLNINMFNKESFEKRVSEFMKGWLAFLTGAYPNDKNNKTQEAVNAKDEIIKLLYQQNLTHYEEN